MKSNYQMRFWVAVATVLTISLLGIQANSQGHAYKLTEGWVQLPQDLEWGQLIGIEPDADGTSTPSIAVRRRTVWEVTYRRCSSSTSPASI